MIPPSYHRLPHTPSALFPRTLYPATSSGVPSAAAGGKLCSVGRRKSPIQALTRPRPAELLKGHWVASLCVHRVKLKLIHELTYTKKEKIPQH